MKIKVEGKGKKFQPIELEIIIESERELCDLWLRLNLNHRDINSMNEKVSTGLKHECEYNTTTYLWKEIDKLCEERELKE